MLNYSPALQEFAYPISICESEADLSEILTIFQHSNCKMLAISDRLGGWKVVTAEDLLSVVAQSWLEGATQSSYSGNSQTKLNPVYEIMPSIKIPFQTAKLYRADLNLNEFLNRQEADFWFQDEICLLVDRQGELKGGLDLHKIIQHLAERFSFDRNSELPSYIEYFASLLDAISLPSKIESRGQTVYANQQWLNIERENSSILETEANLSVQDPNLDRMTKRWIENQESIQSQRTENWNDSSGNLDSQKQQRPINFSSSEDLEIRVDRRANWNYLTIPLCDPRREMVDKRYSLILATPNVHSSSNNSGSSSFEQSTLNILNAASHELKSPLTGIVGLSSLLEGQKLGSLNERQIRYVELIHRSGRKMMQTIDDLLQLNILTANKSAQTEPIDLEFLCRQVYQTILSAIKLDDLNSNFSTTPVQPQFAIESGCEVAVINKPLLSSILSHLMLEAINGSQNFQQLQIQIASRLGRTIVSITSQGTASVTNGGFNLTIAEHLAAAIGATVNNCTTVDLCQLTLLLPKNKIQFLQAASDLHAPTSTSKTPKKFTILCLYPELEVIDPLLNSDLDSNFDLKSCLNSSKLSSSYQHRIIEADSIEQAHNLARIWHLDAIILNSDRIARPSPYLRSLQKYQHLASLPLITLDTKTTEAANQIEGLNVFPCLLPSQCRSIEDLIQVIQIAIES